MTAKYISTYIASGYTWTGGGTLKITPTGGIGGTGLTTTVDTNIYNHGKIANTASNRGVGVYLEAGGDLSNLGGGVISGGYYGWAIDSKTSARILNNGTLNGGVTLNGGGFVYCGVYGYPSALIAGQVDIAGGAGRVDNIGTIRDRVELFNGGNVINGSPVTSSAYIGEVIGNTNPITVSNYGLISGINITEDPGVLLAGGVVTNGSAADTGARIVGGDGVFLELSGTVTNLGVITGTSVVSYAAGVTLESGGAFTNGSATDRTAVTSGYTAALVSGGAGTVVNFATIQGLGVAATQFGVDLTTGGSVTNGGGSDRSALIEGGSGVQLVGNYSSINNFGTIMGEGGAGSFGAAMSGQDYLTNGSRNNAKALIEGYAGLELTAVADTPIFATNFGVISGLGDGAGGVGVVLGSGGAELFNEAGGLIEGYTGVTAGAYAVVENFGTIEGAAGISVDFTSPGDVLVVGAGSAFIGQVLGDGGTLELASGVGTISNFGTASLTVSGSMAPATFSSFGVVEIAAGAQFTGQGAVTIAAGQTVENAGTLTLGGAGGASIANAGLIEVIGSGVLTLAGAVTGKGAATIAGGTLDLASSFTENVKFSGTTGVLELAQSQGYTGAITGFSKTNSTSLDLVDISFVSSTEATFSGTSKSGVLTVTDGTHTAHITLVGNYTKSTFVASSDGHLGTIVVDPKAKGGAAMIAPSPSLHPLIAAMAAMAAPAGTMAWAIDRPPAREALIAEPRTMIA